MKTKYILYKTVFAAVILFFSASEIVDAQYGRPPMPPWMRGYPGRPPVVVQEPQRERRQVRQDNYDDQPYIKFSIHFDPLLSWFSTNSYDIRSDGVVPGFNFGVSYNKYFSRNYSFSSGMNIIRAGGRLINRDMTQIELKSYYNTIFTVDPGELVAYRITYLSVPLGLKLQTDDTGFGRFFTDIGFDPEVILGGRADIPSLNIKDANANPELNLFNLAFHVTAGMEYPMSRENYFIVGLGFQTNLFDVTRNNNGPFSNLISQKIISLRLGVTF
jgi:hypothetical protein